MVPTVTVIVRSQSTLMNFQIRSEIFAIAPPVAGADAGRNDLCRTTRLLPFCRDSTDYQTRDVRVLLPNFAGLPGSCPSAVNPRTTRHASRVSFFRGREPSPMNVGECSAARSAHEDAFAIANKIHTSTVDARRLGHGLVCHFGDVRRLLLDVGCRILFASMVTVVCCRPYLASCPLSKRTGERNPSGALWWGTPLLIPLDMVKGILNAKPFS